MRISRSGRAAGQLIAAMLAVHGPPAVAADPSPYAGIPGIRFEYYDIEGSTPAEIYRSMRDRSPMRQNGTDGLGRTSWQMDVTWRESTRGGRCRVSEPKTQLSIAVLLPRLITRDVSPEGRSYWEAVRRGLDIHEAGHARIAWDNRDSFNKAALRAGCKSIHQVAKAAQARITALQKDYDRDTEHGVLQTPHWAP